MTTAIAPETENKPMTIDNIDRQRSYVEAQKQKGHGLGVVFADAFLRGMRDLGYKNPAWALAEQLDNSFQSGASTVAIRFAYASAKSRTKPVHLAICDDGNGMIPEMISYAVRWGGTDREGDRTGFGRYGYGLPSSSVSLAKRYTVYSKPVGGAWHAVTVDIDQLAKVAGDVERTEELLTAKLANLPKWLLEMPRLEASAELSTSDDRLDLETTRSGTVVVLEDLDRLNQQTGWMKTDTLRTKLLQHFGVIYRYLIPEHRITVDGAVAEAVDPLFLMEHGRFYRETSVLARPIKARTFDVQTSRGTTGTVAIRASLLPPDFQLVNPSEYGQKGAKTNKRFQVMKDSHGLILCREGRQIDTVTPTWTKFQNHDLNVKIEINFDAELDEFFGITTAKQQIVIDDAMWEKLQHGGKGGGGLNQLLKDMRHEREKIDTELKAATENKKIEEGQRASAAAMADSEKFKGSSPEPSSAQSQEATDNLDDAAAKRAAATGETKDEALEKVVAETKAKRWEVEFAALPEGPIYRPFRLGEQKRVIINTEHPFFTKMYNTTPAVRPALEVLLFVLAERELEVRNDAETFYKAERQRWSERLRHALDTLVSNESMQDTAAAVAEQMYMTLEIEAPESNA